MPNDNHNDILDNQMMLEIERNSWHEELLKNTRSECYGLSDKEIMSLVRNDLRIDTKLVIDYCMAHIDTCFGKSYMQVAREQGFHNSAALRVRVSGETILPDVPVFDCSRESIDVERKAAAVVSFEEAVRNDSKFFPYCQQAAIDPDDPASAHGYAFSFSLLSRFAFLVVAGALVLPLLFVYLHSIDVLLDFNGCASYLEKVVAFQQNLNLSVNPSNFIWAAIFIGFIQLVCVLNKIRMRIFDLIFGHIIEGVSLFAKSIR